MERPPVSLRRLLLVMHLLLFWKERSALAACGQERERERITRREGSGDPLVLAVCSMPPPSQTRARMLLLLSSLVAAGDASCPYRSMHHERDCIASTWR